ncbi:MAG: GNAT family N-acetyltransferase [Lawsonibacter sp.]|jgi:GNAT superfamily N-acetyltransferase|nr:GNAT family N-acetyltransferase [Lawsonibacter sp.]
MEYIRAAEKDTEQIFSIVQDTIRRIYPNYYPQEVADFFCRLHCRERILEDVKSGLVGVLQNDGIMVGTGCRRDNHITRVYVKPEYQGKGYGSYIMQCLENEIRLQYDTVYLDASLPASHLYEKRGYQTVEHKRYTVENGKILIYEVMEKPLFRSSTGVCYDGKCFVPQKNTENGEVDGNTRFMYHQKSNIIWADYTGGEIIRGCLLGTVAEHGELDFYYVHVNEQGQVRFGVCHSVPQILDNGKIELSETWQWLNGDKSKGISVIVEV